MYDFNNMYAIRVGNFLCGSLMSLAETNAINGEGIDVVDDIRDIDVILGDFELEEHEVPRIALVGTEPLLEKIGNALIKEGCATNEEVFDSRSILDFLGGSSGYRKAYRVVQKLKDFELNMLISWMVASEELKFCPLTELSIASKFKEDEYKEDPLLQMKVCDIVEKYQMYHSHFERKLIGNKNITIIPSYYWIQLLKIENTPGYNHVIKQKL